MEDTLSVLSNMHDKELAARVRGILWALRGLPVYGPRAPSGRQFIEEACRREARRLEKVYGVTAKRRGPGPGGRPRDIKIEK
jgi:hypothetical protein